MAPRPKHTRSKSKQRPSLRRVASKRPIRKTSSSLPLNEDAHTKIYFFLKKQIDNAWDQLQSDVKRRASPQVIIQDSNRLMLLLGECEYIKQECKKYMQKESQS